MSTTCVVQWFGCSSGCCWDSTCCSVSVATMIESLSSYSPLRHAVLLEHRAGAVYTPTPLRSTNQLPSTFNRLSEISDMR